jgi:crotonobetainyl-CoA:carnitine CoA-transferase CaiB-like acyl-CoA transferase
MSVLKGITIIDFTQAYSGPFCTMNLGDFGARVIKIERKGSGDQSREWTPIINGNSGYFACINRNKESVEVDLNKPEGVEAVKKLIAKADVVVENFKVGTMKKLELDYEAVAKINPRIIYGSLSGFGQNGPLKDLAAYDNVIEAVVGLMDVTGFPDGPPTRSGPALADCFTGLNMVYALALALYNRMNTGEGQYIDVAMLDVMFNTLEPHILFKTMLNVNTTRVGNGDPETLVPYDCWKCKDGYFAAGLAGDAGWDGFCNVMGRPDLVDDPRFNTNQKRCDNLAELEPVFREFFLSKTRKELQEAFVANKVPNGPVQTIGEMMSMPQLIDREMVIPVHDPGVGKYQAIGNPMKMSKIKPAIYKAAPLLGEDTYKILEDFGLSPEEIKNLQAAGAV